MTSYSATLSPWIPTKLNLTKRGTAQFHSSHPSPQELEHDTYGTDRTFHCRGTPTAEAHFRHQIDPSVPYLAQAHMLERTVKSA